MFGLIQSTRPNIRTCWLKCYVKSAASCYGLSAYRSWHESLIAWPLLSINITQPRMTTQSAIRMLIWEKGIVIWRVGMSIALDSSFVSRNAFKYYTKEQSLPRIKQRVCFWQTNTIIIYVGENNRCLFWESHGINKYTSKQAHPVGKFKRLCR